MAMAWLRSGSSRELAAHLAVKQPLQYTDPPRVLEGGIRKPGCSALSAVISGT